MNDEIASERTGPVLRLRINRPDKKNAITTAMYSALAEELEGAATDPSVRAVTLQGGKGIFTSGNDLKDFQQNARTDGEPPVYRFLRAISTFPKVIVAGVAGQAVGIGTTMLLHCDLVIASPSALFSLPFVDLGLVPEAASSLLLPGLIGRHRASKHLLLGDPFDAQQALAYGLVTDIVEEQALDHAVATAAARIAAKPPQAVAITKRLLKSDPSAVEQRIAEEGRLFAERLQSPEAREAFAAFFEKRPPRFG